MMTEQDFAQFSKEKLSELQKDYSFLCQNMDPFKQDHPQPILELLSKHQFETQDPFHLTRQLLLALDSVEMEMRNRLQ